MDHTERLRHALRDLKLDERDERYLTHYARIWDTDTVDVITGWIEQARSRFDGDPCHGNSGPGGAL